MAEIVATVEISRHPDEVFAYAADPVHHPAWVGSVVSARRQGDAPLAVGSKVLVTRRLGPRALATTEEMTELNPPTTWANRGIAGLPVIAVAKGRVAPLDDGTRSRVTITLTFEGHGIGKLLAPILARRQARQCPKTGRTSNNCSNETHKPPRPMPRDGDQRRIPGCRRGRLGRVPQSFFCSPNGRCVRRTPQPAALRPVSGRWARAQVPTSKACPVDPHT